MYLPPSTPSDLYREKARKLRELADRAATPNARQTLNTLAYGWDQMALRFSRH